jgi:hypothetical protein
MKPYEFNRALMNGPPLARNKYIQQLQKNERHRKNMHFVDFNVVLLLNTPLLLHFVGDLDKVK